MGNRRALLWAFITVQVGVPTFVLIWRLISGELLMPWGWQMFS